MKVIFNNWHLKVIISLQINNYICRKMRQTLSKILKVLLLVLFIVYYGSSTLFIHTHILNNNYRVHSHPFSDNSSKKPATHNHTPNEYTIIQSLTFFASTLLVLLFVALFAFFARQILFQTYKVHYRNTYNFFRYLLRAPPLSISFT